MTELHSAEAPAQPVGETTIIRSLLFSGTVTCAGGGGTPAVHRFVELTGGIAAIGALPDAVRILAGKTGTIVTAGGDYGAPDAALRPPG